MWTSLLPHQKKGKKLKPADVLVFPWENKVATSNISQEEKNRLAKELWAKVDQKTKV